ncbi:hypothetical protein AB6A40_010889 [Gnathostoma spinigerum]|uniref:Uncharacterized protein n=1 Tax=Gnathostoma spinigerum TaxID=75299 RepID=A0ABD6F433_9BILA
MALGLPAVLFSLFLVISDVFVSDARLLPLTTLEDGQTYTLTRSKRASDAAQPDWDSLGWVWGKRAGPHGRLHTARGDPDWEALGWAWGRK